MKIWKRKILLQLASEYQTKRDFRANNRSAYEFARKYGYLNSICTHMIQIGNKYNRCVYCYEFPDNHVYVGITYNFQRRKSDRENRPDDTVTRYINKTGLQPIHKQLTDYINVEIARKLEGEYVEKYKNDGWQILNIVKTGGIGGSIQYWTKEKCIKEALKYNTLKEFRNNSGGAYYRARVDKWLDEICMHMNKH